MKDFETEEHWSSNHRPATSWQSCKWFATTSTCTQIVVLSLRYV